MDLTAQKVIPPLSKLEEMIQKKYKKIDKELKAFDNNTLVDEKKSNKNPY